MQNDDITLTKLAHGKTWFLALLTKPGKWLWDFDVSRESRGYTMLQLATPIGVLVAVWGIPAHLTHAWEN